jgi:hypothetical protein
MESYRPDEILFIMKLDLMLKSSAQLKMSSRVCSERRPWNVRVMQTADSAIHDIVPKNLPELLSTEVYTTPTSELQCLGLSMSYLKHAKQCLYNQSKFSRLNAFIALADSSSIISRSPRSEHVTRNALSDKLIAIKDNICTDEFPTTAASGILKGFTSPYDATVVKQLRHAGATIAGKTNMDEFGMGSHSTHSHFGYVLNENLDGDVISAGGSSGGSAVVVATGQCWAYVCMRWYGSKDTDIV